MELPVGLAMKEAAPTHCCHTVLIDRRPACDGAPRGERRIHAHVQRPALIPGTVFMKGDPDTQEQVWAVLSVTGVRSGQKHTTYGESGI